MAKKPSGHRANKNNDSFGTINNENLYRNAYRKDVYKDDDEQRAESRLADWFGAHYGNSEMASHVSVFGSIDKCANGLQEIIDAGAQMLMLNPVFDQMEHLHSLKEEVIPLLKSASSRSAGH